jgi:uncharacterized membrane protein YeaQ/YmgE (transglycosylase-associated protein family)
MYFYSCVAAGVTRGSTAVDRSRRPPGENPTSNKRFRFEYIALWGIISTIIIGLIVGAIARFLMPGKDPGGWMITILIGLAGSFIGTYLGPAVGLYRTGEPAGIIGSIVGAMVLLLLYRLVVKRRT